MISIIVPFHNEKENLEEVISQIEEAMKDRSYEVVLVDDGSTDNYLENIQSHIDEKKIILVKMRRQMGKGKALKTGIEKSKGEFLAFMDADLQDDPADILPLMAKLEEGYDLVNGFRHNRKDNLVIRIYSKGAQWFLNRFLRSPFSDINCGFKIFRRKILNEISLYGNNFRFFPLAAFYEGFAVTELPVNNRPRIHGSSKYGISKLLIGVIDTVSAYFLYKFAERPMHFFGIIGSVFFLFGFIVLSIITYERIFMGILLYRRPALQYGAVFIILGIQVITTGILGELLVYLHNKKKDEL